MKITVITGSPRKNGTSKYMADEFIRGAEENGHEIYKIMDLKRLLQYWKISSNPRPKSPTYTQTQILQTVLKLLFLHSLFSSKSPQVLQASMHSFDTFLLISHLQLQIAFCLPRYRFEILVTVHRILCYILLSPHYNA